MSSTADDEASVSIWVVFLIIGVVFCVLWSDPSGYEGASSKNGHRRPRSLIDQEAVDFVESDEA